MKLPVLGWILERKDGKRFMFQVVVPLVVLSVASLVILATGNPALAFIIWYLGAMLVFMGMGVWIIYDSNRTKITYHLQRLNWRIKLIRSKARRKARQ